MNIQPIGILGGTFDPIHYGHLRLAEEMLELANLRQIRFIPTGMPPHRDAPQVPAEHRAAMVRLAIADQPAFVMDEREVRQTTPCFTVDTLRELRAEFGASQPLCLLMGGDAFLQLHTWHEWEQLFELAHIVVGYRPGFTIEERIHSAPEKLRQHYQQRLCSVKCLLGRRSARLGEEARARAEGVVRRAAHGYVQGLEHQSRALQAQPVPGLGIRDDQVPLRKAWRDRDRP